MSLRFVVVDLRVKFAQKTRNRIGLRAKAIPETGTLKEAFEVRAKTLGMTWEQFQELLALHNTPSTPDDAQGHGQRRGLHGFQLRRAG